MPAAARPTARASRCWPLREIVAQARGERTVAALAVALGLEPVVGHQVARGGRPRPGAGGRRPRLGVDPG